jgi:hypothetical protein
MPSADFCPITPDVTARRAARVTLGSGGTSSALALALSPAPVATTAPGGFDGDSSPFELALSSTPLGTRTASETVSPDKVMNFLCTTSPFTVPTSDHRTSLSLASSPPGSAFYAVSVRRLADLLQASFRPRLTTRPLPFASSCRLIKNLTVILLQGTFTPSVHAHAGRTKALQADPRGRRRAQPRWFRARSAKAASPMRSSRGWLSATLRFDNHE